jgi:serine/threonine protein kinase
VVVKRILPSHAADPTARRLFLDEARLAVRLRHPAIVGAIEVGDDDGAPFLVLELVDGRDLGQVIGRYARAGRPPAAFAAVVAAALCRGLEHAHALTSDDGRPLGLVHRDVSPSNVLIGFDGAVKLGDFGVARVDEPERTRTAPGTRKGKPHFLAPEQLADGATVDARADLFAVGVLLHEALTGRRLDRDVPLASDPAVPAELERICRRALAPLPSDRYPDAGAMADELEAVTATLGGSAALVADEMRRLFAAGDEELTAPTREAPHDRRRRGPLALALGVVVAGAIGALLWWHSRSTSPPIASPIASPPPAKAPPRHKPAPPHRGAHAPASDDPLARQKDLFDPFHH